MTVDIYIDLEDYLRSIYLYEIAEETHNQFVHKRLIIVSQVINLVAHIRSFFKHRCIGTRIFLVYGDDSFNGHTKYYPNFNAHKYKEAIDFNHKKSIIESQLSMIKLICGYIHDVYYIRKSCDFTTFVNFNNNPVIAGKPVIVWTKSVYAHLLAANNEYIYLMRPKKYKGEDLSYIVTNRNVLQSLYYNVNQNLIPMINGLHSGTLGILFTLLGNREFSMARLCNITTAVKMIYDAVASNSLIMGVNSDPVFVYNGLKGIDKYCDLDTFCRRFYAVDLYMQSLLYGSTVESMDCTWNINLSDPISLRNINNSYFADNPLDLNSL
jgi:hypothetical protein